MIVLLLASSIAAALVPIPEAARDSSTPTVAPSASTPGRLFEETLRATAEKPREIRAEVDDELALTVTGRRHDLVEVSGLGQLEDLAPGSPARFDLLFDEPGTYTVRLVEADQAIGRIAVTAAAPEPDEAESGQPAPAPPA